MLESLVRAQSEGSDDGAGEEEEEEADYGDEFSPVSGLRSSETDSVEDFLYGDFKQRAPSPPKLEDSLFVNEFGPVTAVSNRPFPPIRTTLFPIGGFKHEKDCKMLLAALKRTPNIQEILEDQSNFWAVKMSVTEPDSSAADKYITQYARQALAGDNPIKIAKIVQAVASATLDVKLLEKLVLLVDRLIVSDDEYLCTLEGMECALEQGRLLTEMGQVRRSWWVDNQQTLSFD